MVLWKYTFREVRNRPGRAMLTLMSIIVGVAAVVAVSVGRATTQKACKATYESVAGRAALEVAAEDNKSFFKQDIVGEIAKIPGVTAAVPCAQSPRLLHFGEKRPSVNVIGIDPQCDKHVRAYESVTGKDVTFAHNSDAILEASFAEGMGIKVGDRIKIMVSKGRSLYQEFNVIDLVRSQDANFLSQVTGLVFIHIKMAGFLFANVGEINNVSIVLDPNVDEKRVEADIAKLLPAGLTVHSPTSRAQMSRDDLQNVEVGLQFSCVLMIGVAIVMIINTFLMNVGERRRHLAVLRAIGATRRQVVRMLLLEGLAMGVVGTVLGSLLGLAGAHVLSQIMAKVYGTTVTSLAITTGPFILAAVLGPCISLLAMFIPAYLASRISPLEGMRFVAAEGRRRVTPGYVLFSLFVFAITGSLLAACVTGYLPIQGTVFAGVLFTLAFLLLIPIMLQPLSRLAAAVLHPILGIEGHIAQRQVLRRRVRTTLTIGILYVAASSVVSVGTLIINNVEDIRSWQAKTFKGDYFVRSTEASTSGLVPSMPAALEESFRSADGVASVEPVNIVSSKIKLKDKEQNVVVFCREFALRNDLPLDVKSGDANQLKKQLAEGQVVIGTILGSKTHTQVSDNITLTTAGGDKSFRVAATTTVYMNSGMVVFMDSNAARESLGLDGVSIFAITMKPDAPQSAHENVKAIAMKDELLFQSAADLRARLDGIINSVVACLWGILALGFLVGAFGIANTLTMNVLEQTRELAMLRVVAMTRKQVRKTILAQAMIIGFIGLTIGTIGGVSGSYISNLCSTRLIGHAIDFSFQPQLLGICFAAGMAVVMAAAWMPAERAARLNLLIALQYE